MCSAKLRSAHICGNIFKVINVRRISDEYPTSVYCFKDGGGGDLCSRKSHVSPKVPFAAHVVSESVRF